MRGSLEETTADRDSKTQTQRKTEKREGEKEGGRERWGRVLKTETKKARKTQSDPERKFTIERQENKSRERGGGRMERRAFP